MTRHKIPHGTKNARKVLQYWRMNNQRPVQKKTARGATNTTDGKVEKVQPDSASNDTGKGGHLQG